MGNGQCPECYGVPKSWHGHPDYLKARTIGHEINCKLAESLRGLGDEPLMKGDIAGPDYETYWTQEGFLSTRIITAAPSDDHPLPTPG